MLSRKAIREILLNNRGSVARVARDLGVNRSSVSRWLAGERPQQPRIEAACRKEAERLLRGEA